MESQGVELWVDGDGLHYDGDISVITSSVIDELRNHKQAIIDALMQPAANDEPLPIRWMIALSILDFMTDEKRSKLLYTKALVKIQRKDWRHQYQLALSLNDWETERLEQDLRSNDWVYFNDMYETVERTTPDYEAKASELIEWADAKGIKSQFLTIPTGIVNHGRIRNLPSKTVEGLKEYMLSH